MVKSVARTAEEYLRELPEERRAVAHSSPDEFVAQYEAARLRAR
jgi:hypothetical protein